MNNPSTKPPREASEAPLNPALTKEVDKTFTPDQDGSDPLETISVKKDEGAAWPLIWAIVTIACVIIALVIFIF